MRYFQLIIHKFSFALLISAALFSCDSPRENEAEQDQSAYKSSAGTSRAITKADRNPEVELILDEMNYIGVGNDINVILAANVLFGSDQSTVIASQHPDLDKLGRLLAFYPEAELQITGYAPESIDKPTSKKLAQSRADAIKKYMVDSMNIQANRITASQAGAGDETNAANEKQTGQRVEVLILTQSDTLSSIIRDSIQVRKQKERQSGN